MRLLPTNTPIRAEAIPGLFVVQEHSLVPLLLPRAYHSGGCFTCVGPSQMARPNSYHVMHSPIPRSCIWSVLAKHSVRRMHRCIRVRSLLCGRAMFCVGSPARRVKPRDPIGRKACGPCHTNVALPPPAHLRSPLPRVGIPGVPPPARRRWPRDGGPHGLTCGTAAPTPLHLLRPPACSRPLLGSPDCQHGRRPRLQRRPFLCRSFDACGGADRPHTSRLAPPPGVHRHGDALLCDLGGVPGVGSIPKDGAALPQRLWAAVAWRAWARCAMAHAMCPWAVGAGQDVEDHRVTRARGGLRWLSYTPSA